MLVGFCMPTTFEKSEELLFLFLNSLVKGDFWGFLGEFWWKKID